MSNEFLHIGNNDFINVDKIDCIFSGNAKKIARIAKRKGIDTKSIQFWNTTGEAESRSLILLTDGVLVVSMLTSSTLIKRLNDKNSEEQVND